MDLFDTSFPNTASTVAGLTSGMRRHISAFEIGVSAFMILVGTLKSEAPFP
jgi:hypothetical protein